MNSKKHGLSLKTRMRVARALGGFSQRTAAERLQMSVWRFWRVENGISQPTATELRRIRAVLGVDAIGPRSFMG